MAAGAIDSRRPNRSSPFPNPRPSEHLHAHTKLPPPPSSRTPSCRAPSAWRHGCRRVALPPAVYALSPAEPTVPFIPPRDPHPVWPVPCRRRSAGRAPASRRPRAPPPAATSPAPVACSPEKKAGLISALDPKIGRPRLNRPINS